MNKDEILNRLNTQKNELINQISMIEKLEIKAISSKEWKALCDTPLRYSHLILDLAKETFPQGKNFEKDSNYVYFLLNDFKISIPTCKIPGITIDMSWYNESFFKEFKAKQNYKSMRTYFQLLDSKNASWEQLARSRCNSNYSKIRLFFWWFGKSKWKKVDRNKWEDIFKKEDSYNTDELKAHKERQILTINRTKEFHETVDLLKTWDEVRGFIQKDGIHQTTNIEDFLR